MGATNKTSKLKLCQWLGEDSPMRADFNADNSAIDSAFQTLENTVSSNKTALNNSITSLGSTLRGEFAAEVERLEARDDETRRFALDAYNNLLLSLRGGDISALEPNVSGVWCEKFSDLGDFDFSLGASNRLVGNSPFLFQPRCGCRHTPLGSTTNDATTGLQAIVFELDKPATITALTTAAVWAERMYAFKMYVYAATRGSDGSVTVGDLVYEHELTSIGVGSFRNNLPSDANIHLDAGTYVYAMGGSSNCYYSSTYSAVDEAKNLPPEYARVGYTFNASTKVLTATAGFMPHISVEWSYDDGSLPRMVTKLLDFGAPASQAVAYVYSSAADQMFEAEAVDESGSRTAFSTDARCEHVEVSSGLYLTRYTAAFASPTQKFKLEIGYGSATGGVISNLTVATIGE